MFILFGGTMHMHNQTIFDTVALKEPLDILSILPVKNTRERLKTQMIRVDHAGELGAVHIYRGQTSIFVSSTNTHDILTQVQVMGEHEKTHLNKFNDILPIRRIRPSLLSPLWQTGGFLMGVMTALISDKSAMACTEAVETVIDSHYDTQITYFTRDNTPDILLSDLKQFQQDELAHKQEAIASNSHTAPFYKTTKFLIET